MTKPTLIALKDKNKKPKSMTREEDIESFYKELEVDVLARTLWGEARGEGDDGMRAVAHVILNRVAVADARGGKYWWGANIIQVCQKPYQFSCWNRSDPNFKKLQEVDDSDLYFATALRIARRMLMAGCVGEDKTKGATHYHAAGISPYWAKSEKPSAVIGNHIFYLIIES